MARTAKWSRTAICRRQAVAPRLDSALQGQDRADLAAREAAGQADLGVVAEGSGAAAVRVDLEDATANGDPARPPAQCLETAAGKISRSTGKLRSP